MAHPSYKVPTIQEAVCELQLNRSSESDWSPSKPSRLIEALSKSYKDFETLTEQGYQVAVGPNGTFVPTPLPPQLRLKLSQPDKPYLVQVSTDTLSVNVLKPYPGWNKYKAEILNVWPLAAEIIKPLSFKRIGIRYINRIPRRQHNETVGEWLKPGKNIPIGLTESCAGFLHRLEKRIDDKNLLIVSVTHDRTQPAERFGSILFDIDRVVEGPIEANHEEFSQILERLHEEIWEVFEESKGPRLEAFLNGKMGEHESAA